MNGIGFMFTAGLLAIDVYLVATKPGPVTYASTAFVGAVLLFQAALLVWR